MSAYCFYIFVLDCALRPIFNCDKNFGHVLMCIVRLDFTTIFLLVLANINQFKQCATFCDNCPSKFMEEIESILNKNEMNHL